MVASACSYTAGTSRRNCEIQAADHRTSAKLKGCERGFVASFHAHPCEVCSPPVIHGPQRGSATRASPGPGAPGPQAIRLRGGRWYRASPLRDRPVAARLEARGVPSDPAPRQRWGVPDSPQRDAAWPRRQRPGGGARAQGRDVSDGARPLRCPETRRPRFDLSHPGI